MTYNPTMYGEACATLLGAAPLCPLGPGEPDTSQRRLLESLTDQQLFASRQIVDPDMAGCCRAGLWLLYNYLDESHHISQGIETPSGSYWHGIMHRREPDYDNAKYWFRRVGRHPVFGPLNRIARELVQASDDRCWDQIRRQSSWDAFHFVDCCSYLSQRDPLAEQLGRRLAQAEWELLFDFCYRGACGITTD